ncbi:hypothetical protein [Bacillus glycinifermentans]|uniref:Uncharacterized protein n=1 Tax=Bacillus glycinifermentans TaxID=1664069 RepID=A0A0T6BPR2_9BACI|nr:hypothetical protein [Bacillus glycinifermentans]ATH94645.1 hypothetical protein COP00_20365 [Bacillus glycinifermentans]KRT93615.1 hypothetical protein AB447_217585 [Bacillus glycinifermentans]MEC0486063.1 hypothetical protein [Bacillus glycinifermentans]
MTNIVIYYRRKKEESVEKSVENVNKLIQYFENFYTIKGIFLDDHDDRNQFNELLNFPLKEIDILYTNHYFDDEFDNQLINQLSKAEHFSVKYIDNI